MAKKKRASKPEKAHRPSASRGANPRRKAKRATAVPPLSPGSFPIVGVGASAGGLEALSEFLKALPARTGMAVAIIQHLAPQHESALTQLLSKATSMPVIEVSDGMAVERNHVYVIPPDTIMTIQSGALQLIPRERASVPHHAIDEFFTTLAREQKDRRHRCHSLRQRIRRHAGNEGH